jgi:rod shape-determining protein MreD
MNAGRRRVRLTLFVLAAFVLHAAFGSALQIRAARPNLALTALLVASLFTDAGTGAALGFLVGLLEAAYSAFFVGSLLVTRSLAGWVVGALEARIFRDSPLVAVATALTGTFLVEGCFFLFAPQANVLRWLLRVVCQSLYNAALALPLFYVLRRLMRSHETA